MIPLYTTQLIQPKERIISNDGSSAQSLFYLIRDLFLRTGGQSGIPLTVGASLVAAGSTQADAFELSEDFNEVISVPVGNDGVRLAALQPGQSQKVVNADAVSALKVYPAPGGSIDAAGIDVPYSMPSGTTQIFTCYSLNSGGGSFYRTG